MDTVRQIKLEKWITGKDIKGNNIETVQSRINTFSEVHRLSGDRASINGATNLDNVFLFRMRINTAFDPTGNWRIIYDGRMFTVHSIEKENEKRFFWLIKAEAQGKR